METQDELFVSAANSPSRCSVDSMSFYSAPTSPTKRLPLLRSHTEPTSPRTYEDSNSNLDDFEFETSRRCNHIGINMASFESWEEKQHKERGDSLPTMAFADELFCDGKVMPLAPPLKLPPSFRGRENYHRSYTAVSSPARSPRSMLKLPLSRQCLWNDDFDPFMAALENVREEKKRGRTQANKNHRRAWSLSPLRVTAQKKSNGSLDLTNQQGNEMGQERPIQLLGFDPNERRNLAGSASTRRTSSEDLAKQVGQSPTLLAEPKGLMIARQLEKMNHENKPRGPDTTPVPGPKMEEKSEASTESGGAKKRVSKRQRLKNFLLRSLSSSRVNDEDKAKIQNLDSRKPSFMRRFNSFRSGKKAQNGNGEGRGSSVVKLALVQYRPRLSFCLGYGMGRHDGPPCK